MLSLTVCVCERERESVSVCQCSRAAVVWCSRLSEASLYLSHLLSELVCVHTHHYRNVHHTKKKIPVTSSCVCRPRQKRWVWAVNMTGFPEGGRGREGRGGRERERGKRWVWAVNMTGVPACPPLLSLYPLFLSSPPHLDFSDCLPLPLIISYPRPFIFSPSHPPSLAFLPPSLRLFLPPSTPFTLAFFQTNPLQLSSPSSPPPPPVLASMQNLRMVLSRITTRATYQRGGLTLALLLPLKGVRV